MFPPGQVGHPEKPMVLMDESLEHWQLPAGHAQTT
jgi:hypothetical protein